MDQLLSKAGSTIVTFAIRSGVQIASSYVIKSVNQLMDSAPDKQKRQLERLKSKLQTRIEIVSYAMELIQLVASRGNTNLESTLRLVSDLKLEIDEFEENIDDLAKEISTSKKLTPESIKSIQNYMQSLLVKIEQAIPVINLALTTSGANLSGSLNSYISPGRLLNTTVYMNDSNLEFERSKKKVKVGPDFDLTFYNIFYNANRGSEITWREKFARCKLQIFRVPVKGREYSYEVELIESFDDGRYHDDDDTPEKIVLKVEDIARLFYSASGKLLKLDDRTTPVLVLKTKKGKGRGKKVEDISNEHEFEWLAVGDYLNGDDDDDEDDEDDEDDDEDEKLSKKFSSLLKISQESSLSLVEYLLRLCALQESDQISILKVKDEKLRLFLNDENSNNNRGDSSSKTQ
ncbi:unnamed protein product [Ambrosiozyma monospora]|uniref:Unnamed protein product n=1 Tax=Ambrosiozyma monospora TaxID=43982 RepID=A0A9W6YYQ9_AMBMO|nr:unnamed protein product [Ambrosiozyma monospora]